MVDVFTPEKRSDIMSRIHGRDTAPELTLRSLLHRLGYRFTVNGPLNRSLPGKPDIVLPKYRSVIFVHGCFWHSHTNCPAFRLPKSRTAW
jgi:DNA mismatch endonuclease (patch repair protein)